MYNHLIDTFRCAAEQGSYAKAADLLMMSPANVLKQIRALESILTVPLLERSNKGVSLTKHGELFYKESSHLIELSHSIIYKTKNATNNDEKLIGIGVTPLSPLASFNQIWKKSPRFNDFFTQFIYYPSDINGLHLSELENYYEADVCFCSEPLLENKSDTEVYIFNHFNLTCAVPMTLPISRKDFLSVTDLEGHSLLFPSRGNSSLTRQFIEWIHQSKIDIKVEAPSLFYDIDIVNRCAREKTILVSLDYWKDIHPGLVNIPVQWNWTFPYGLIWKKNARKEVLEFITAFKNAAEMH
ncbi:MAG: LysR family transcriptional regulator [Lachnospiraceae bacterium]|nr:LysR family transcriptional regulator [Lachnospiraceae bacterium]